MYGLRCEGCGEVRWSILGRPAEHTECPACGEAMVEERRRPGRRVPRSAVPAERREVVVTAAAPPAG